MTLNRSFFHVVCDCAAVRVPDGCVSVQSNSVKKGMRKMLECPGLWSLGLFSMRKMHWEQFHLPVRGE